MGIDLNQYPTAGRAVKYSRDAIERALRLTAYKWVPELFPNGRREDEAGESGWRVADITGRRPRDRGSCRIWLTGDHAGDWIDFETFDNDKKGGVFSTLKKHLGLDEGAVYSYAIDLVQRHGGTIEEGTPLKNGNGSAGAPAINNNREWDIKFYLQGCEPAAGTPAETYWQARKLGVLPQAAFSSPDGSPDFLFNPDAANRDTNYGHPSIICRFRYPNGTLTGAIHICHLRNDGSWHIGPDYPDNKRIAKKTWGPRKDGGVVMLAPISAAGELGIGEGIESTAAGMLYYGAPGWAACGTAAMVKFGQQLRADPSLAGAIKRLLIWADVGKGGEASARRLAYDATCAAVERVELYLPRSGDDFAADLMASLPPPDPITEHPPIDGELPLDEPEPPPPTLPAVTTADLQRRLSAVKRGELFGGELTDLLNAIANAPIDRIEKEAALTFLAQKSGVPKKAIIETFKHISGEILPNDHISRQSKPWLSRVALGNDGDPKGIMANVAIVLRDAAEVKGCLGFNEFTGMIWVTRKFPWEFGNGNPCDRSWTDNDELALMEWIQGFAGIHANKGAIFDAVQRVASENAFHPVRQYLWEVRAAWDGRYRLDTAAWRYFGAVDNVYHREVFKRWIISAVARVMRPGVKADNMTVFEGPQGLGKSTAIRILFDPNDEGWFTDQLSEMGTKDASLELRGIWCAEYSDLEGMTRAESKTIKAYMSRTTDRFRPPYGRVPIREHRQCVFAGTTNDREYLKDATGGRRFWPLVSRQIDRNALIDDRNMIWGEAVAAFEAKACNWWIDETKEPELAQIAFGIIEARYQADAWESVIKRWLDHNVKVNVTADELMRDALEIHDKSKWSRNDQIRIGYIMRRLKWVRGRDRNMPREYRYWHPDRFNPEIAEEV